MKKAYTIFLTLVVIGLSFHSCTKDDSLLNDGDSREAFIGDWAVTDACSKQAYRSTISIDVNNSSQVVVSNFANLGNSATAVIAGNSIYIEFQDLGNGYIVGGNGKLNGDIISWTSHNFESIGNQSECTANYSKVK